MKIPNRLSMVCCWGGLSLSALAGPVSAQLILNSPTLNLAVPDGDFVGVQSSLTVPSGGVAAPITDVSVIVNIAGEFVGDLYVQLIHNGQQSVLLNRVGRTAVNTSGYDDGSLSVRFQDSAALGDIHNYRTLLGAGPNGYLADGLLTGTWQPDGRNVSPLTVEDTSPRGSLLGMFLGADPTGTWTLFLADTDAGSSQTLVSWGLEISTHTTSVPEAGGWFLSAFGFAGLFGIILVRGRMEKGPRA